MIYDTDNMYFIKHLWDYQVNGEAASLVPDIDIDTIVQVVDGVVPTIVGLSFKDRNGT